MPLFRLLDMDDLILAVKESILNRLVQPGLVTFDRQQVIGLPGNDLLGNRPLAAHGVNTDEEAFQVQGIEQFGNGGDLVALRRHFLLTKYQTQPGRKGADHVNGRFAAVAGTAHGFAVDRDGATQIRDDAAHPPAKAAFELLRVEQAEDPQKGVFRRNAVLEHQKLAQPGSHAGCHCSAGAGRPHRSTSLSRPFLSSSFALPKRRE